MSTSLFLSPLVIRAWFASEIPEGDPQQYVLEQPLGYRSELFGEIIVPAGYRTDFASIPRAAWSYMDPEDPVILYGSVVHDWLYTHAGQLPDGRAYSRELADKILREAMASCRARRDQLFFVYNALRLFGGSHWNPPRKSSA